LFLNSGLFLLAKASIPIFLSSDPKVDQNTLLSNASPSVKEVS
jgi:hypothetical protein